MALTRGPGYAAGTGNAVEIIGAAGKGIAQGFKTGNKQTVKRIQKMTKKRDEKISRQTSTAPVEPTSSEPTPTVIEPGFGDSMRQQVRRNALRRELQGHIDTARQVASQAHNEYQRPAFSPEAPSTLDEAAKFAVKKSMMTHYKNQVNANLSALQHNNNS